MVLTVVLVLLFQTLFTKKYYSFEQSRQKYKMSKLFGEKEKNMRIITTLLLLLCFELYKIVATLQLVDSNMQVYDLNIIVTNKLSQ